MGKQEKVTAPQIESDYDIMSGVGPITQAGVPSTYASMSLYTSDM